MRWAGAQRSRRASRWRWIRSTSDLVAGRAEAETDARWQREWEMHQLRWALHGAAANFEAVTLQAFEMHVLQGRSVEETASALGLSKASVYQARSRVLKSLRERLADIDPEGDL